MSEALGERRLQAAEEVIGEGGALICRIGGVAACGRMAAAMNYASSAHKHSAWEFYGLLPQLYSAAVLGCLHSKAYKLVAMQIILIGRGGLYCWRIPATSLIINHIPPCKMKRIIRSMRIICVEME